MSHSHEPKDDRDYLRQVVFDGYCLRTWATGRTRDNGGDILGYEFVTPEGQTLFTGEEFGCGAGMASDSDDALRCLIGFLTLQPGDTDADYFDDYTSEQMAFAKNQAEELHMWSLEDLETDEYQFTNIDGWVSDEGKDEEADEDEDERNEYEERRLRGAANAFRARWGDDSITVDKPDEAYSRNDPKGWCGDPTRGAAMGRYHKHVDSDFDGVITLRAVQLDDDYDVNGTYFGQGEPLWWYSNEDGTIDAMLRARSRDHAKEAIADRYPQARFNR